jgi:hypothetical protein
MEIIRFLLLRAHELQIAFHPTSDETGTEEEDFCARMLSLIGWYQKEQSKVISLSLWFRSGIYKIHFGKKKLISLKRKKLYVKRCIKILHTSHRI